MDNEEYSEDAFEESAQYEFNGQKLWFSYRHYFALTAISSKAEMSAEEQVLLVFWIATHSPEEIKQLRADWRRDQDDIFDRFEDVPEQFNLAPGSQDMLNLAEVVNKMWNDIDHSRDKIKANSKKGGAKNSDGQPGK